MVYKGLGCIEACHVPNTGYVYFEVISKNNTLLNLIEIERVLGGRIRSYMT